MKKEPGTVGRAFKIALVGVVLFGALLVSVAPISAVEPADQAPTTTPETVRKRTVEVRVSSGNDDVEELGDGQMYRNSGDLEFTTDPRRPGPQAVGIRFAEVAIPAGATIEAAWIDFWVDEPSTGPTSITVKAEAAANSAPFGPDPGDVTKRPLTSAGANWSSIGPWATVGAKQRTVDLSPVVREVLSQPGWRTGNPMTFVLTGDGRRVAESYEGNPAVAPRLHVDYSLTGPDPAEGTVEVRVASDGDDVEQLSTKVIYFDSSDLELGADQRRGPQTVGIHFRDVGVPSGATIETAWIEFQVDEPSSESTSVAIRADRSPKSPRFTATPGNVTSRPMTSAVVRWDNIEAWNLVGERKRTPDLAAVVQEVVSQPGWTAGNALTFAVSGQGRRVAESYHGNPNGAPLLHIEYTPAPVSGDWAGSASGTDSVLSGEDWSGLDYRANGSSTGILWASNNSGRLVRLSRSGDRFSKTGTWPLNNADGLRVDAESLSLAAGDDQGIYVGAEGHSGYDKRNAVYRYELDGDKIRLTDTWSFGDYGPGPNPVFATNPGNNQGIEALTWIPDCGLRATGDPDCDSSTGLFAIGIQNDHTIYLVDLQSGQPPRLVTRVQTSLAGVAALEWADGTLWAHCDTFCGGQDDPHSALLEPDESGKFREVATMKAPDGYGSAGLEGFAVAPVSDCGSGTRTAWWSNDDPTPSALYKATLSRGC